MNKFLPIALITVLLGGWLLAPAQQLHNGPGFESSSPEPGCDTLINVSFTHDTAYIISWDTPNVGTISGTGAIDLGGTLVSQTGIAEAYDAPQQGYYVNTALIFPAMTIINPSDSAVPVTVYLYDNTGYPLYGIGPFEAPGNALDSTTITLKELAEAVTQVDSSGYLQYLTLSFPHQPALADSEFFVGISLPQLTGDTIAFFTNSLWANDGRGWLGTTEGWMAYDSLLEGVENMGFFMVAIACPTQALPPIAAFMPSATFVCVDANVTFSDGSTQAPTGWYWDFGDGTTDAVKNPVHAYTSPGTYIVIEYAYNANGATEAVTSITVVAGPAVNVVVTNDSTATSDNGSVIASVNGGSTPYTYAWSFQSDSTDTLSDVPPGNYTVTVTDGNQCTTTAAGTVIPLNTGIITLGNSNTVLVFPNPAAGQLNLVWSQNPNAEIAVLDLEGKVVMSFAASGDMKSVCNIHNLAAGNYILRITDKVSNEQQSMMFSKM